LGATPVRPLRVRESRLSWRLDACCSPLGDCGADPDPWSLLQGCHVLRESKICACRGLVACCVFFGRCRMAPGSGVILQGRHAPCDNQPIATNVSALSLLREIPASRTSLGRSGETRPLTRLWADVAHDANDLTTSLSRGAARTFRRRQLRVRHSFGSAIPKLC